MFLIDLGIKGLVRGASLGNGLSFREARSDEKTAEGCTLLGPMLTGWPLTLFGFLSLR